MTIRIAIIGDPFIPSKTFKLSLNNHLKSIKPKINIKFLTKDLKEKNLKPLASKEVSEAFGNQNDVIKVAKSANILITTFAPITEYVLKNCKNLSIVACGRGGPINVNIKASTNNNVMVLFAPGRNIDAVVEYTLANIINLVRKIPQAIDYVKKNKWKTPLEDTFLKPSGDEIHNKTIGVIGYGAIGKKLTRVLEALDVKVLIYEPFKKQLDKIGKKNNSSLNNIFRKSDIITIHARINKNGKPLIGKKDFNKMKKKPYIINTSRSQCVESESLIYAYKSKKIKGFYLDVFDEEPIPNKSKLHNIINSNIILTPHAAGVSRDIPSKTAEIIAKEIKKIIQNQKPKFVTNPEVVNIVKKKIKKLI